MRANQPDQLRRHSAAVITHPSDVISQCITEEKVAAQGAKALAVSTAYDVTGYPGSSTGQSGSAVCRPAAAGWEGGGGNHWRLVTGIPQTFAD